VSRIIRCNPDEPDDTVMDAAAQVLKSSGLVVLPTETQYGLAIRADQEGTLEKICRIKKREATLKPALFVKDMEMARKFCRIDEVAVELAEKFLPGPLTLVLPPRNNQSEVPPEYLSPDGFGIRISSSPVIKGIMNRVTFVVSATSANISGRPAPATVAEIERLFGDNVDLYLDAGPCRAITPSTVVRVNGAVAILRHGQIARDVINRFLAARGEA
jgi:L-threonylcarbamoyladenylate synthase